MKKTVILSVTLLSPALLFCPNGPAQSVIQRSLETTMPLVATTLKNVTASIQKLDGMSPKTTDLQVSSNPYATDPQQYLIVKNMFVNTYLILNTVAEVMSNCATAYFGAPNFQFNLEQLELTLMSPMFHSNKSYTSGMIQPLLQQLNSMQKAFDMHIIANLTNQDLVNLISEFRKDLIKQLNPLVQKLQLPVSVTQGTGPKKVVTIVITDKNTKTNKNRSKK